MILVGLGSNLPFCGVPPQGNLKLAIAAIGAFAPVEAASRFYRSPAWPDPADPDFVNAAIAVKTALSPRALLAALHRVEAAFGRRRDRKNAPRTLDLDLLAYDRIVSAEAGGPTLPHPGIASRSFVLAPICDMAPDWRSPATNLTAREMLTALGPAEARPLGVCG